MLQSPYKGAYKPVLTECWFIWHGRAKLLEKLLLLTLCF